MPVITFTESDSGKAIGEIVLCEREKANVFSKSLSAYADRTTRFGYTYGLSTSLHYKLIQEYLSKIRK
jgi:hypothetical protein